MNLIITTLIFVGTPVLLAVCSITNCFTGLLKDDLQRMSSFGVQFVSSMAAVIICTQFYDECLRRFDFASKTDYLCILGILVILILNIIDYCNRKIKKEKRQ